MSLASQFLSSGGHCPRCCSACATSGSSTRATTPENSHSPLRRSDLPTQHGSTQVTAAHAASIYVAVIFLCMHNVQSARMTVHFTGKGRYAGQIAASAWLADKFMELLGLVL